MKLSTTSGDTYEDHMQKIFELKIELLCEYKKRYPNKKVYLTEENLNMVFKNYKFSQNN